MFKSDKNQSPIAVAKKPAVFKIKSKFKEGQTLFTLDDGKIVSGTCTGFKPAIISNRNYLGNHTEYEIQTNLSTYVWANEENCYPSMRALLIGIKK